MCTMMIVMLFAGIVGVVGVVEHYGTAVFVLCEQIHLKIVGNLLPCIALVITQYIYIYILYTVYIYIIYIYIGSCDCTDMKR